MNGYPSPAPTYDQLRQVVDPSLAHLPPLQLRAAVDSAFGEGTADSMESDLEGIFGDIGRAFSSAARDVGRFAQQAAPVVAHIGSGVLQGAMAGSAAGLPGIIAGAAVGGAGAGLSRYGSGTARDIGGALTGVTSIASQFSPAGRAGAGIASAIGGLAGGSGGGGGIGGLLSGLLSSPQAAGAVSRLFGGGAAAGQFASLLQRPEVQQALGAMRLGPLGRRSIPVGAGGPAVPTAAFAQLLGHQLGQVAAELAEAAPDGEAEAVDLDFMRGAGGGYAGDPSNVRDRAARLWFLLNEAQADRFAEAVEAELSEGLAGEEEGEWDSAWDGWESEEEFLDSLDLAEAEAIEASLVEEEAYAW